MHTSRTSLIIIAIICVFSTLGFGQSTNLLINGEFEDGYPNLTGWILRGSTASIVHVNNPDLPDADSEYGKHSLTICGEFNDPILNSAFVYQILPATPGDIFDAYADLNVSTTNPLKGEHIGFIRIAFFSDPDGQVELGGYNSIGVNSTTTPGEWIPNFINTAIAPTGTTHIGYYIFFQKPGPDKVHSEDAVFFDNAILTKVTTATLAEPIPEPIPTMSEWGLIILLLLLLNIGVVSIKSNQRTLPI